MKTHGTEFISTVLVAGLLAGCVATTPPPLPANNPAEPQARSFSKLPQLFARDETTREIERELSATAHLAQNAESMPHEGHNMPGMQHGPAQQPETKSIAEEMKETSDEMKATSDAMKKKSDELKVGASIYTCPMHPEVQSDKPGNCPKCGMKLVEKEPPHEGH